jgi:hypothetical protein
MYKVRWFSVEPSGTYARTSDAATRDEAIRLAREYAAMGMRAIVFERRGRRWGTAFDTAVGY